MRKLLNLKCLQLLEGMAVARYTLCICTYMFDFLMTLYVNKKYVRPNARTLGLLFPFFPACGAAKSSVNHFRHLLSIFGHFSGVDKDLSAEVLREPEIHVHNGMH